ncbi:bromo adjacent homology domain-containing 1 protein [Rhinatrema bivittatum]|uniref:bromo adjacent homology domain-containing 1 protein n=1 Tax=Rhinatrema bivittatum TaxID=194408 RepID=UPI00112B4034|nr:bromo adjacent homology domain-containing 1 protein [Rhinatrema bivittatum]XP_029454402.1 bromo adjacent homology domain-containing 1 protein [Rhinatrema bivittatum]XP_029454403.1 bromo adjacent homology domain-containing 1 protein [Rhinatrema bivittatum]XP_029454404.1 bromo adjacent homology domain-containing 1 protein [Rhinatrema bivittatum]
MESIEAECSGQDTIKEQAAQTRFPNVSNSTGFQEMRKSYPLRKRLAPSMKEKTCKVLLTRLEDVAGSLAKPSQNGPQQGIPCWLNDLNTVCFTENVQTVSKMGRSSCPKTCSGMEPNTNPPEPRKRRLASLNAEAVNNLLFEREDHRLSSRRFHRDSAKVSGHSSAKSLQHKSARNWSSLQKMELKLLEKRSQNILNKKCSSSAPSLDEMFEESRERDDGGVAYHPAPKRLASLNAVAFLRLTNEKGHPFKQSSKSDSDSKSEHQCSKARLKWAKSNRKTCVKLKKEILNGKVKDQHGWQGDPDGAFRKVEHQDSLRDSGKTESIQTESFSNYYDDLGSFYHRLPLLMGGQAAMKPEYGRPGEKSPTPKQEFHQPSFPVQQFHHLPVPGTPPDCTCFYESLDLTSLDGFYVSYGQSGLQYNGYSPCSVYPNGGEFTEPANCDGLLVSQSCLPSGTPLQHLPWCNARHCFGEEAGVNSYSLCGVVHVPSGRISNIHTDHNSYPYKMPFTAESCKSLDQLSLTIPVAGHPVSPAHPFSGCPVPSVPPAAEPVPYLQTPNSEPQTMARLKMARECPQSSKPPSGSKSGVRNTTGCFHASDTKASRGHSHPKQQRISRRRATNGWIPVGAPCEKAVYVVNEPEPAVRKSYQAVEREGEVIRVRDTVLLKSGPRKKSMPYVAKISALWEDPKTGELMMSLFWYYRPEHTHGGRNSSMHQNEIFASRHQDENSVACIEEKCYVLTFAEYCRFCALVKRRGEGIPGRKAVIVPPSEEYCTPPHRKVPENTDPDQVFLCRHVYDFRHGRILKNPQ